MLANTGGLREALPVLFRQLGVRHLLDAPCGDCNWISDVELPGYTGCDVNEENLARAAARGMNVVRLDIVNDPLPHADLMLCRDFHQHLPTSAVMRALRNFCHSGIRWLLATSHDVLVNEPLYVDGLFRPLNLTAAPFDLGAPHWVIADGSRRVLGLWSADQVRSLV